MVKCKSLRSSKIESHTHSTPLMVNLSKSTSTSEEKGSSKNEVSTEGIPGNSASNITEFLAMNKDIELIGSQSALQRSSRLPSSGCLSSGLLIRDDAYQNCILGHNNMWNRMKKRLLDHFNCTQSKTHMDALGWWRYTELARPREKQVVENQIRTALGIVKTKSAALSYETRIAKLQMAGADVVDFAHGHNQFNDILKAANVYITKQVQLFLFNPLQNTGLPPHFYITADKSTNHRVTNQVSMICPIVNGERKAIPLTTRQVHEDFSGHGGLSEELAQKCFEDLNENSDIGKDDPKLMQVQGKVFDGQYLNGPFIQAMNKPLVDLLSQTKDLEENPPMSFGGLPKIQPIGLT